MKIKYYSILALGLISINANAQWNTTGTNNGIFGNTLGTANNFPILMRTNSILRATVTTNNGLTNAGAAFNTGVQTGDGISITANPASAVGATLDLFTSIQNQTFIRMDGTALMGTTNSRFETTANINGFWYNATGNGANAAPGPFTPQFIWNIIQQERGRLGSNGYWRFGGNAGAVNANNIVEIVSQGNNPYGITGSGLRLRNLRSTNVVTQPTALPLGNGIDPSKVLSVDKNGDVVLINGGFGALCASPADITAAQFTASRAIDLNNFNFEWRNGRVGFGTTACTPGNRVEITGLAAGQSGLRLTNLTSVSTPVVNLGTGVLSVNANGDVIYVPSTINTTGNNGISITAGGVAQLGVPCNIGGVPNLANIFANQFTTDRVIANRNQNFWIASFNTETGGVGIGGQPIGSFCNTGNTFEVSANMKNPQYGNTNASGMRFTKLVSSSPTVPNGTNGVVSTKVLTVDGDGDVVLTDAIASANADNGLSTNGPTAGFVHLGQNVGAAGNPGNILNDREIPLNTHNIYFTGQDNIGQSAIYVGFPGSTVNRAKVNVLNTEVNANNSTAGILGINRSFYNNPPLPGKYAAGVEGISDLLHTQVRVNNIGGKFTAEQWYPIGVKGTATNNNSSAPSIGVQGDASSVNGVNIGGNFSGTAGTINNTGVSGVANGAATSIGVRGQGNGTTNSYGGYFFASGATTNYAVYADVTSTSGSTPPTGPDYAGYFNGDVYIAGSFGPSDQNLKEHVDSITNALSIIKQLKPKSFDFKHSAYPSMHLPSGKQYGLIAQEVETILPALVSNNIQPAQLDSVGNVVVPAVNFKGLEYQQLIPFLIKAIQEQQTKIDSLTNKLSSKDSIQDARLTALENAINQCCSNNSARHSSTATLNQLDIELSDKDAIVLNQNVPNPFAEQTTITYNVPATVEKAQIIFYNSEGQIIQTVDIKTRGKGKVNVFAADLSSGLYHYTLVADGKVVDSKKMVRE